MHSIGFIGAGNMGKALIESLFLPESKFIKKNTKIWVFDRNPLTKKKLRGKNINWTLSSKTIIEKSTVIFLCIKPKDVKGFFAEYREVFHQKHILISIVAGLPIASIRTTARLPRLKVCRIMPNLASSIGRGAGTVTYSHNITTEEKNTLKNILKCSGLYFETKESLVNAVTSISGCGPAFVFLFIEALAQAAVKMNIPRHQALSFASETVIGAGLLLQALEKDPLELTAQVTSPGGMTIEGVNHLNNSNFRKLVMEAVFLAHAKAELLFK